MKKIYTFITALCLFTTSNTKAQDTLLYEGFQFVMDTYCDTLNFPSGTNNDAMYYNYTLVTLSTAAPGPGFRPKQWWQTLPYATADLYTLVGDTNIVMTSNSWFEVPNAADDWFITPFVNLGAHDTLFFKSASYQTPRYLDGFEVRLSNTTNDPTLAAFSNLLYTAAENTAFPTTLPDSSFAPYTFAPAGEWIQGIDGTYIEYHMDSMRFRGILHPDTISLDAFHDQRVYIAFHHNSFDDNLISIDDVMIRGSVSNPGAGILENTNNLQLSIYPNPSQDNAQLSFTITSATTVVMNVYDVAGKLIANDNKGEFTSGRHFANINTSKLAKGFYTVAVQTTYGISNVKLIVQ